MDVPILDIENAQKTLSLGSKRLLKVWADFFLIFIARWQTLRWCLKPI